jgi:hypothetical protein
MAQNEPYFILCALSVAYEFIHEALSSENAGAPAPPLAECEACAEHTQHPAAAAKPMSHSVPITMR